jgi:hypothetical protein
MEEKRMGLVENAAMFLRDVRSAARFLARVKGLTTR